MLLGFHHLIKVIITSGKMGQRDLSDTENSKFVKMPFRLLQQSRNSWPDHQISMCFIVGSQQGCKKHTKNNCKLHGGSRSTRYQVLRDMAEEKRLKPTNAE